MYVLHMIYVPCSMNTYFTFAKNQIASSSNMYVNCKYVQYIHASLHFPSALLLKFMQLKVTSYSTKSTSCKHTLNCLGWVEWDGQPSPQSVKITQKNNPNHSSKYLKYGIFVQKKKRPSHYHPLSVAGPWRYSNKYISQKK